MDKSEQRWIGIGGLAFVVLALVLVAVVPMPPSVDASSARLTSHYAKSKQGLFFAGGFVTMAEVVVGMFWFVYFRDLLASTPGARRLATAGLAGATIFGASGGMAAGHDFVLSDAAGKASLSTIRVLNYLPDLNLGLTAIGVVVFLVATALVVIRFRGLPLSMGWLSAVFAVASFVITPAALPALALWMIPTNIVLIARSRSGAERTAAQIPLGRRRKRRREGANTSATSPAPR
jgi:hypothetical protein